MAMDKLPCDKLRKNINDFSKITRSVSFLFMKILRFVSIIALVASVTFGLSAQQPSTQATPVEIKIAPPTFDAYVGQYEDAANLGGSIFSIFRDGDKFYLQVTNQDRIE